MKHLMKDVEVFIIWWAICHDVIRFFFVANLIREDRAINYFDSETMLFWIGILIRKFIANWTTPVFLLSIQQTRLPLSKTSKFHLLFSEHEYKSATQKNIFFYVWFAFQCLLKQQKKAQTVLSKMFKNLWRS